MAAKTSSLTPWMYQLIFLLMKKTMLEYFKIILDKVSFDRRLFKKEYRKSLLLLTPVEAYQLKQWWRERTLSNR
jgi:hypothetical protein